jgi:serine/threonine protein kinase
MPGEKKSVKSGPFMYMAPESFKEGPFDGALNDIWSCGIILYEILAGETPCAKTPKKTLMTQVKRGTVVYPKSFSSTVIALLKGVLHPMPSERFSIEQILAHAWMLKSREVPISSTLRLDEAATAMAKAARDAKEKTKSDLFGLLPSDEAVAKRTAEKRRMDSKMREKAGAEQERAEAGAKGRTASNAMRRSDAHPGSDGEVKPLAEPTTS